MQGSDPGTGFFHNSMSAIRQLLVITLLAAMAWWLIGDTYRRYASHPVDGLSIRFSHFGTFEDYGFWKAVIDDFENLHPGMSVRQEYVVGKRHLYDTKNRQQIMSGDAPDVFMLQLGPFQELAPNLEDLSFMLESGDSRYLLRSDSLHPTAIQAFSSEGTLRAMPVSGGNLLIYCNLDCVDKAARFSGRPVDLPDDDWTVAEFRAFAEQLTCDYDRDGAIDQFGFWQPRWVYYLPFLWSFGARLTNDDGTTWMFDDPSAEKAMAFYRGLAVGRRVAPRDSEVPQIFQDTGFLTGKVAMCVNGPWFQPFLAKTRLANRYAVLPIPSGSAGRITRVTWDGIAMMPSLPPSKKAVAIKFIDFILSQKIQDRIARSGKALPARLSALPAYSLGPDANRREVFIKALEYARLQPNWLHFGEVDRAINKSFDRLLDSIEVVRVREVLRELASKSIIKSSFPGGEVRIQ